MAIGFTLKHVAVVTTLVGLTLVSIRTESPSTLMSVESQSQQVRVDKHRGVIAEDRNEWNVLNFGTSVSWGAGIEDRYNAYPYLLNRNATNLAIRASGPCYPSVCTQTMVGNEAQYNVITLEFFTRSSQGLERLAKRLRKRFPNAVIVVVRRWNPLVYKHMPSGMDFQEWMTSRGFKEAAKSYKLHDPEFHLELFATTTPSEWLFNIDEHELRIQEEVVNAVGGYLVDLPRPADFREAIAHHSHWFAPDLNHLSREGHEYIANEIQTILNTVDLEKPTKLGSWGGTDYCESWFLSGQTDVERDSSVRMVQFDERNGKWALEIPTEGGWMTVINPFDEPQSLFLTYMVTGPPPSIYPETFVYLGTDTEPGALIDPTVSTPGPKEHIGKTSFVGTIPPGETTLRFQYWEDTIKDKPLRVTGYAIVGLEENVNDLDASNIILL